MYAESRGMSTKGSTSKRKILRTSLIARRMPVELSALPMILSAVAVCCLSISMPSLSLFADSVECVRWSSLTKDCFAKFKDSSSEFLRGWPLIKGADRPFADLLPPILRIMIQFSTEIDFSWERCASVSRSSMHLIKSSSSSSSSAEKLSEPLSLLKQDTCLVSVPGSTAGSVTILDQSLLSGHTLTTSPWMRWYVEPDLLRSFIT
mmetsp:Transcript_48637/g.135916  ORF Transcript_48637/g.135916 Transcript_48637/m.135916 type:complete len:206 (+) Transcript_48637:1991-2608(+)